MKIAVDLDDMLCSFIAEFLKWYNPQHGANWQFEDVVDYHWSNFMHITAEQAIQDVHDFFLTSGFANLPVMPGAQEFIRKLAKEHELYIVTARQHVAEATTYTWLEQNFSGVFRGVLFANHYSADGSPSLTKGELCQQVGCELIIDDDGRHLGSLLAHNIKAVLIDKPWNKNDILPAEVIRAYNWDDALRAIEKLLAKSITIN
ncbi:TPA: hypothetical protein DIV45_00450 [Patescibacteria group bacterium]|uniref:Nucleotidase n=1 Tax=candidate division Kazan bacterium GW2011_GWB1_45_10 TaxID=1620411 RepID=A0A0G1KT95_UNCK3|nr:MAG: hypothetical protein VE97_C0017G0002 [candidate division Kazan bacterium GW2011_GWB1_45_10]HCR41835.1 hypothetical protein [Patescibacteria group bacterium]